MSSRPAATRRTAAPRPARARVHKRAPRPIADRQIDDRLPSPFPVTAAEVDLLDRMLGSAIDAILRR